MKALRNFSRIIIAPVFIFSGFVKAVDPLGSAYKFTDYFEAFGMDFLIPIALPLSFLLCITELVIGLSILMNVTMRFMSWALLVFMSFFTVLTFISALTSPVSDCGCFGDALILTNWQTFWKNVIFMLPTLVVFYGRKRFRPIAPLGSEWGIVVLFIALGTGISIYNYNNLPAFDFRPYSVGTHIPSAMEIPEGAAVDEYETTFIYAKNGEEQEFAIDNIPYTDTTWKYVDRKTVLINKGYVPPIHDFTISTLTGQDITDSVLSNPDWSVLVISHNLEKADEDGLKEVSGFVSGLAKSGVEIYGLTASTSDAINQVMSATQINFHTTDEVTLKTIIRSNPGVLLLKDGVVVSKWHYNNVPGVEDLEKGILPLAMQTQTQKTKRTGIGFYLLLLTTVFSLLSLIVKVSD